MRSWKNISSLYACLLINPEANFTPSLIKERYQLLNRLYRQIEINLEEVDQYQYLNDAYNTLRSDLSSKDVSITDYRNALRTFFINMSNHIRGGLYQREDHLKIVALAGESLALIDQTSSIDEMINAYLSFLKEIKDNKQKNLYKKK